MNIYARYFDHEFLAHSLDELLDFLIGLKDIEVDNTLVEDLESYINSDTTYPKRCKVRPRVYFILIKTAAKTLEEFKSNNKATDFTPYTPTNTSPGAPRKESRLSQLQERRTGWYFGRINFKRVILIPGTQKFQYRDTTFSAYVRTNSGMQCYQRIIEHLKGRQDIDSRSQFPSVKGNNFIFDYIGEQLPEQH